MKLFKIFGMSLLIMAVTGCAIGNQYDYRTANVSLPLTGDGVLGVGVLDNRSYVLSGEKEPNFVGLQRGGFANPFNVTTASGKPLTDDMSDVRYVNANLPSSVHAIRGWLSAPWFFGLVHSRSTSSGSVGFFGTGELKSSTRPMSVSSIAIHVRPLSPSPASVARV